MNKPVVIVTGAGGQVGQALLRLPMSPEWTVKGLGRSDFDITDRAAVDAVVSEPSVVAVINLAAYTAVDAAEKHRDLAFQINHYGPAHLAQACAKRGLPLVQVSTDYVFDGAATRPWRETDQTSPVSVYGESKLAGELAVAQAGCPYAVLRTAWVFGVDGGNFVKTMLRVGSQRDALKVVADQVGGPTPAKSIAETCLALAQRLRKSTIDSGVYHYCGQPQTSWHGFATAVFKLASDRGWRVPSTVEAITTAEYPTDAKRPAYSVLDCNKIETALGVQIPDWRTELASVIDVLTTKD